MPSFAAKNDQAAPVPYAIPDRIIIYTSLLFMVVRQRRISPTGIHPGVSTHLARPEKPDPAIRRAVAAGIKDLPCDRSGAQHLLVKPDGRMRKLTAEVAGLYSSANV